MQKRVKNKLLIACAAAMCLSCVAFSGDILSTSATANETAANTTVENPSLEIVAKNLSYSDSTYILYAVANEGFDRTVYDINLLFWTKTQDDYTIGTEEYAVTSNTKTMVNGVDCLVFYSQGLAAKEMTTDLYTRACVEIDNVVYYSEPVKYSVLEYVHSQKEKGGLTETRLNLFHAMLTYGAAAQENFEWALDRLANDVYYKIDVVNGTLPDGFARGRYQENDKVTLTANAAEEGFVFSHWVDETGAIVSENESFEIIVTAAKTYTAVYEEETVATEGLTYTLSSDKTYYSVTGYEGTDTDVVIPAEYEGLPVKEIGYSAFQSKAITGVEIPEGITTIGNSAFRFCTSLQNLVIPDSVTQVSNYAFSNCTIENLVLIGSAGFRIYAFEYANITNLYIPNEIDWYHCSFENYNATPLAYSENLYFNNKLITEIIIPDTITQIRDYTFTNYEKLLNTTIPEGVTSIGVGAFSGCTNLISITLPETLTVIRSAAFGGCESLVSIEIPESVYVENRMFSGCDSLTKVILPKSITTIGDRMFYRCTSLTDIVLPEGVTKIDAQAFSECSSLKSIVIPYGVTAIGNYAFENCIALKEIVIPDNTKSIGRYAFYACSSLESVEIGDSITILAENTFAECRKLTRLKMGNSITTIANDAFRNCPGLTGIVIPNNVTAIGDSAFSSCANLTSVYYQGSAEEWATISISSYNDNLTGATRYYYSESEPSLNADGTAYNGRYWKYGENGEIVVWTYVKDE